MNTHRWRKRRWLAGVVGTVLGLLPLGVTLWLALSWRDRLPGFIVSHWNAQGVPDDMTTLGVFLGVLLGIGAGCVLLFSLLAVALGQAAMTRRVCAAFAAGMGLFMGGVVLTALAPQLDSAADSSMVLSTAWMMLSLLTAVGYGFGAVWLIPGDPKLPATEPVPETASRFDLAADMDTVWVKTIEGGVGMTLGLVVGGISVMLGLLLGVVLRSWHLAVVLSGTGVLVLLLVYGLTQFTVSVDDTGLRARSKLGWPKLAVPANEVLEAEAIASTSFLDFGGYGYRTNLKGEVGIITRDGAALKVRQTGDRTVYISVDDAARGAALLNSYASRARSTT
ncbi:MAG: hypothetical protein LBH11_01300 [Propionibacteriaceae bacterium]|jgi:MFS family permease|nr:hypothetical protein [Propionibacteriaceae bacterium]